MIKSILVLSRGVEGDDAAFDAALLVARAFAAHLDFLYVRPDAADLAAALTLESGSAALLGQVTAEIEAESDRREKRARGAFDRICAQGGLAEANAPSAPGGASAAFLSETGSERDIALEYALAADLVLSARPSEGEGDASALIETVLVASGRPLLLLPTAPLGALPERVAIAWKGNPEAARAAAAAVPFLERAKEVVILSVAEGGEEAGHRPELLVNALRWHGVAARVSHLPADARGTAETLLAAAGEEKALLVMGGYGHSRLREWVFGGVTRRILEGAPIPVLLAH